MQVLYGPRQSGKTTLGRQLVDEAGVAAHYASADDPSPPPPGWIAEQWTRARDMAAGGEALLVLDEIQKVPGWTNTVKAMWDDDSWHDRQLKVLLLGSSPLLLGRGMSETMTGRFEVVRVPHWSYTEMKEAFGLDLERYLFFGGYPGGMAFAEDHQRWLSYIRDAVIGTTVARDVLLMTRIDKPALLAGLLRLGCAYSGRILSYTKMLGQLHDAGNTTTLAHYLDLLRGAWLVAGLQKFAGEEVRRRSSSPKLIAMNTALVSATLGLGLAGLRRDGEAWGHLTETAVGAHLLNSGASSLVDVYHWRERSLEVDFVIRRGKRTTAIEVKSGRARESVPGLDAFDRKFHPTRSLVVGSGGVSLEEFMSRPAEDWL